MSLSDATAIRALQTIGITSSAMLSGMTLGFTAVSVPMMQVQGITPTLAARQWLELYNLGKPFALGLTLTSVLINSYLLYRAYNSWPAEIRTPDKQLLLGAIVAAATFVLYTKLFMEDGINTRLSILGRSAQTGELTKVDAVKLGEEVKTWTFMHNIRVFMPAVAAVLGFLSTL